VQASVFLRFRISAIRNSIAGRFAVGGMPCASHATIVRTICLVLLQRRSSILVTRWAVLRRRLTGGFWPEALVRSEVGVEQAEVRHMVAAVLERAAKIGNNGRGGAKLENFCAIVAGLRASRGYS
jgi:hypothetical protein